MSLNKLTLVWYDQDHELRLGVLSTLGDFSSIAMKPKREIPQNDEGISTFEFRVGTSECWYIVQVVLVLFHEIFELSEARQVWIWIEFCGQ